MDGVTILNTYMGLTTSDIVFLSIWGVVIGGIGIICIVAGIVEESEVPVGIGLFALVGVVCFIKFYFPRTEHIQAIVNESVSWAELTERYEVIKTEGRIITMIEREKDDDNN